MRNLNETWQGFGTSIFTEMSLAAQTHNAVNLSQGFPDFDGPDAIKTAAIEAIKSGHNQYAPSSGLPMLREAIAKRQANKYDLNYDPNSEVSVFSGASEALFCAINALCVPGDEVIVFEPFYDSYPATATAAGATVRAISLTPPMWRFDTEELRSAITPQTKAILVNTPHNPTGRVFTKEEIGSIAELALEHDLYIITDEVYEELVFEGAEHLCMAALAGLRERCIVVSSTSKTFSMTGWKIGYALGPERLISAMRSVHQFNVFCSATPLQIGMCAAFSLPSHYYDQLRRDYLERRDLLFDVLAAAGLRPSRPEGSYFVLADYSDLSDLPDREMAHRLTREAGVAPVPLSPFYQNQDRVPNYLRFAFCKDRATIEIAGKRLREFFGR